MIGVVTSHPSRDSHTCEHGGLIRTDDTVPFMLFMAISFSGDERDCDRVPVRALNLGVRFGCEPDLHARVTD